MESCCETDSHQSSFHIEQENRTQAMEVTPEASVLTSVDNNNMHNTDVTSSTPKFQNDEEFASAESVECARWSSLDSLFSSEELSSCDLPASNVALNVTFNVDDSSICSYMSMDNLLDPKCALKIVYDLDESAGIDQYPSKSNKTFVIEVPQDNCISTPRVQRLTSHAAKTLSPAISKPLSMFTDDSLDDEDDCHNGQISGKTVVKRKGKITGHKSDLLSDFGMANGKQDSSYNSFDLEDKGDVSARTVYATSTPLSSAVEDFANRNSPTEQTVKLVQRASTGRECPEYVPSARRMLQLYDVNNRTEECPLESLIRKSAQSCEPDSSILNKSFDMSASEQDDYDPMLKDAGCKHDQTYSIGELADFATGDYATRPPLINNRLTSIRLSDRKSYGRRSASSINKSHTYFKPQRSANDQNTAFLMNDDISNDGDLLSVSNIDVFKDDCDVASFFVTEWPSILASEFHALLRDTSYPQDVQPAVDQSPPQNVRIVVKSTSSPSDLFTDWSFSSLLGQVHPSFDSVNGVDADVESCQQSPTHHFSVVTTGLSKFSENTQQLNDDIGR